MIAAFFYPDKNSAMDDNNNKIIIRQSLLGYKLALVISP